MFKIVARQNAKRMNALRTAAGTEVTLACCITNRTGFKSLEGLLDGQLASAIECPEQYHSQLFISRTGSVRVQAMPDKGSRLPLLGDNAEPYFIGSVEEVELPDGDLPDGFAVAVGEADDGGTLQLRVFSDPSQTGGLRFDLVHIG